MIENLHAAGILHADIKADNFLLQNIPTPDMAASSAEEMFRNQPLSLQLIDFGRAIDLTLLPKDIFYLTFQRWTWLSRLNRQKMSIHTFTVLGVPEEQDVMGCVSSSINREQSIL